MRPRTCRLFSSSTSARIEPPSLTRGPLGPFCVMAGILRQLCLSRRQQVRLRKFGRSIGPHLFIFIFIFIIFIFIIFIFAGMYQAGLASILPSGWRGCTARAKMLLCYRGDEMTKRMAVLALAVGMTIPGFMQTGFAQAG